MLWFFALGNRHFRPIQIVLRESDGLRNGTWFLHYTVYPTPFTKERIRRSLGTKDVNLARERRDQFFNHLAKQSSAPALAGSVAVA